MANLFQKDENLLKSAPVVGAEILKLLSKSDERRISLFDIAEKLKITNGLGVQPIYYAMLFLYSLGLIDFEEPYLVLL